MKWNIGDIAAIQRVHEPPACVVIIEGIPNAPAYEMEKYFVVRAITTLVDWSAKTIENRTIVMVREPGETFNAHYAELSDII